MGVFNDPQENGRNGGRGALNFLTRRKRVDSDDKNSHGLLAKDLSVPHLIAIGKYFSLKKCFFFGGDIYGLYTRFNMWVVEFSFWLLSFSIVRLFLHIFLPLYI